MKELELYIHIPFCVRKCKYCDFLSAPASQRERQAHVDSLCGKIRSYLDSAKAYHVVSIFLGGGTPSILEGEQILQIFAAIREVFLVDEDAEITLEANPGTVTGGGPASVTKEKLAAWRQAGINRLSIGLQSAEDRELKALGRIHTFAGFKETYQAAVAAGFSNMNVDLMSAIPFQTEESWERTLRTVAGLTPPPAHISAYSLIIEEGTPFYERYGSGGHAEELPDEDTERRMYERTEEILSEYGYHRYEISNYARPGRECRHNIGYWTGVPYLGLGLGAASYMEGERFSNSRSMEEYLREPGRRFEAQRLTKKDREEEFFFLGLRLTKGVSLEEFERRFGVPAKQVYPGIMERLAEENAAVLKDGRFFLTEYGMDVSNYVMAQFLQQEE